MAIRCCCALPLPGVKIPIMVSLAICIDCIEAWTIRAGVDMGGGGWLYEDEVAPAADGAGGIIIVVDADVVVVVGGTII